MKTVNGFYCTIDEFLDFRHQEKIKERIKENLWVPAEDRSSFSIGYLSFEPEFFRLQGFDTCFCINLRIERKIPPRSLVNDLFKKELNSLRSKGVVTNREQKSELRKKIINNLLPETLPSYKNIALTCAYRSSDGKLFLFIDQSNNRLALELIDFFRLTFDTPENFKPFFKSEIIPSILRSGLIEGLKTSKEVSVLTKDKGLVRINCEILNNNLETTDFIYSRFFENSEISFLLRYDGVIQKIVCSEKAINSNKLKKTEFVLNNFMKILGD